MKNSNNGATIKQEQQKTLRTPQRLKNHRWTATAAAIFAVLAIIAGYHRFAVDLQNDDNNNNIEKQTSEESSTFDAADTTCTCPVKNANHSSLSALMGLNGTVSECCCSFTDIEDANIASVRPLLEKIVETPFFSHFKVDLCSDCELWEDKPLCMLRDCGVCESENPPVWAVEADGMPPTGPDPGCKPDPGYEHMNDEIITTGVDPHITSEWQSAPFSFLDESPSTGPKSNAFIDDNDDDKKNTAVVVDLRLNPEHYTGYSGPSAAKVWSAIHSSNCFQPPPLEQHSPKGENREKVTTSEDEKDLMICTLPAEQRLYNRFISGLHSSISLHIAHTYCLELDPDQIGECKTWGRNKKLAHERVLNHPDRVENLYVAFALLLRAVVKAGQAVAAAVPQDDPFFSDSLSTWTESLLPELRKMSDDCPHTFDESNLLREPGFRWKKVELQRRFRHLQQIMQCVGCDRCKLWGTLQTLGVGTALRVLFHDQDEMGSEGRIQLSRQEAVALVHTLERLSSSLAYANDLRR